MLAFRVSWLTSPEAAVALALAPSLGDRELDESAAPSDTQKPSDVGKRARVSRDRITPHATRCLTGARPRPSPPVSKEARCPIRS